MIDLQTHGGVIFLPVKVVAGASRTRGMGSWQNRAKIAVAAPAESGKANRALLAFIAKRLGVRKRDVTVHQGATAALKTIRIEGATADNVRNAFSSPGA